METLQLSMNVADSETVFVLLVVNVHLMMHKLIDEETLSRAHWRGMTGSAVT